MVKKMILFFIRLLPLRNFILFESHPDFSDNSYALYMELLRRGVNKRYRIFWMKTFRGGKKHELPENVYYFDNDVRTLRESLRRVYILNRARYIIDCNSFVQKRKKEQVRIHLGHGMPIKIDLEYSRKFGECDKYVVLSEFWRDIFADKILVPADKLCYYGYPRNDVLVNGVQNKEWRDSVRRYRRVVLWMPTYRQHRLHMEQAMENSCPYGMPVIHNKKELECFHSVLEEKNILVLFRPHPVQELSVFKGREWNHLRIADESYLERFHMTLYEMLGNADALITDYSSVYFDYLLTDRPIALTIEDREEYFQYFTAAFPDYKSYIKGFYVECFDELLEFMNETAAGKDSFREERMAAKRMFHSQTDGKSAERIADMLTDEYGL